MRHHFGEIVFMVFTSIVCGVKSYDLMEEFCNLRIDWFRKWITLPNGVPSYNTFARVFDAIEPEQFSQCIIAHLTHTGVCLEGVHVAIDGKALRGTRTKEESHIHSVSAWSCEQGLTLAHSFVGEKSNEITAIPALLDMLNLDGAVVTIDAMGTQREIATKIIDSGGDYILCVKGNQGKLHDEITDQFHYAATQLQGQKLSADNWGYDESIAKSHGRNERRQTVVCRQLEWMDPEIKGLWKGLKSIVMVTRDRCYEGEKSKPETHYYITSLEGVSAEKMQSYIRKHWDIENGCHWILDTCFREDHSQIAQRNAAKNLATIRRVALNTLKLAPDVGRKGKPASIPKKQLHAANDHHYLESCLSLV